MEQKRSYRGSGSILLRRLVGFLKIFTRNRRGIFGVGILVFFMSLAVFASFLTPYDPVYSRELSGDFATPIWFKYLPGGQGLSENVDLIATPGFPTPIQLGDWNYGSNNENIVVDFEAAIGKKAPGSMRVTYSRLGARPTEQPILNITREFQYPYDGSPARFGCSISMLAYDVRAVPVEVNVFLREVGGTQYNLYQQRFAVNLTSWTTPVTIDSHWNDMRKAFQSMYNESDAAKVIFHSQGTFIYGVQLKFTDTSRGDRAEATMFLDDLTMRTYGGAFGLLGCDNKGRDLFTQLAYGARISLFVGLLSAVLSVVVGLMLGLLAGYLGGLADETLMRFTDMLLVLPGLPLLLVLIAALGPSIWNIIILIGVLGWMGFARVVRSQVLSLKERPFVEAAKAVGAGKFYIIARHIVPNVMSLVYVSLALAVPAAILSEAALSWLGLFDPTVMSWGRILHEAQIEPGSLQIWWWIVPPGLCIAFVSLSFILLGYALDEILNPKLRQRR